MARVILFGAGASFGSVDVSPAAPPLGDQLFDALASRGGVAATLPEYLKELFRKNFEEGMAAYYEFADGDVMRFQRELAHFLASFTPGEKNVYVQLIKELGINRFIFASLNYDLLFELSAGLLGFNTAYTSRFTPRCVRLLKPHGSSNFWPHMPGVTIRNSTFKRSGRADIDAPIRPLSQSDTLNKCDAEDSVAPAIALYAAGKPVKISPSFVEEQQRMWAESVNIASRICIVGTRIHLPDAHIWAPVAASEATVFYVGMAADRAAFEDWKGAAKKRAYFIEAPFSNAVSAIAGCMR